MFFTERFADIFRIVDLDEKDAEMRIFARGMKAAQNQIVKGILVKFADLQLIRDIAVSVLADTAIEEKHRRRCNEDEQDDQQNGDSGFQFYACEQLTDHVFASFSYSLYVHYTPDRANIQHNFRQIFLKFKFRV